MRIRPADGMIVRHPETKQPIPADGIDVDETSLFWNRRIRQGDVVVVDDNPQENLP